MTHSIPKWIIFMIYTAILLRSSLGRKIKDCNFACPQVVDPVCGYNGDCYETFNNECEMGRENCKLSECEPKFELACCKACKEAKLSPICSEKCPDACILVYDPVCGCNDFCYKTFSNACFHAMWNCQNPYDQFKVVRDGECDSCWYQCPY